MNSIMSNPTAKRLIQKLGFAGMTMVCRFNGTADYCGDHFYCHPGRAGHQLDVFNGHAY